MKILTPILLTLVTLSCASLHHQPYSTGDIYREIAVQTLNIMDYASTDKILGDHPTLVMEANPLLGSDPGRNKLMAVGIGTGLLHGIVNHYLPARYRPYWQWPFIIIKAGVVGNNYHINAGIQF